MLGMLIGGIIGWRSAEFSIRRDGSGSSNDTVRIVSILVGALIGLVVQALISA